MLVLCLAAVFAISTSAAEQSCSYKLTADNLMYGGVITPAKGLEACKELCTSKADCKGFDLNPSTKECWTLAALPGLQPYKGVDHYDKICVEVQTCEGDPCSGRIIAELAKITDDLRAVKSLVDVFLHKACPEGFEYLPEAHSCYKLIEKEQDWSSSNDACQGLAHGAHLIAFGSQEESEAVAKYVKKQLENPETSQICKPAADWPKGERVFWSGGQRVNLDCKSEFVWKTAANGAVPFTYKRWLKQEPNCAGGNEKCLQILHDQRSEWNDRSCDINSCSICEYDLN